MIFASGKRVLNDQNSHGCFGRSLASYVASTKQATPTNPGNVASIIRVCVFVPVILPSAIARTFLSFHSYFPDFCVASQEV